MTSSAVRQTATTRLTCDRRPMGHYASPEGGTVTECTDILDVLDAVLTHLYGPLP